MEAPSFLSNALALIFLIVISVVRQERLGDWLAVSIQLGLVTWLKGVIHKAYFQQRS